jgi:hypothetical protein
MRRSNHHQQVLLGHLLGGKIDTPSSNHHRSRSHDDAIVPSKSDLILRNKTPRVKSQQKVKAIHKRMPHASTLNQKYKNLVDRIFPKSKHGSKKVKRTIPRRPPTNRDIAPLMGQASLSNLKGSRNSANHFKSNISRTLDLLPSGVASRIKSSVRKARDNSIAYLS